MTVEEKRLQKVELAKAFFDENVNCDFYVDLSGFGETEGAQIRETLYCEESTELN